MPLGCIRFDHDAYQPVVMHCLRCGAEAPMRFAAACPKCAAELRAKFQGEARAVEAAAYEPKVNVTPNAVALKDD
jgi:ribosomal protein L40E